MVFVLLVVLLKIVCGVKIVIGTVIHRKIDSVFIFEHGKVQNDCFAHACSGPRMQILSITLLEKIFFLLGLK